MFKQPIFTLSLCWFPKYVLLKSMSTYDKCVATPDKRVQSMPSRHEQVFTNGMPCMPWVTKILAWSAASFVNRIKLFYVTSKIQ